MAAVVFKNARTGTLVACPSPEDGPARRRAPRAARIARQDQSDEWERAEEPTVKPPKVRKGTDDQSPAQPDA